MTVHDKQHPFSTSPKGSCLTQDARDLNERTVSTSVVTCDKTAVSFQKEKQNSRRILECICLQLYSPLRLVVISHYSDHASNNSVLPSELRRLNLWPQWVQIQRAQENTSSGPAPVENDGEFEHSIPPPIMDCTCSVAHIAAHHLTLMHVTSCELLGDTS